MRSMMKSIGLPQIKYHKVKALYKEALIICVS